MNAPNKSPAIVPTIVAALAARTTDPSTLFHDVKPSTGVRGVLVLFGPPSTKPTPATLRTRFEDVCDRAFPMLTATTPKHDDAETEPVKGCSCDACARKSRATLLKSLPDVISPVAALGLAVRDAVEDGARWVHNRQLEKSSRWTYCAATVTANAVNIHGAGTCAEASADGTLKIDPGVPADVATALRAAYTAARGVVEPSRVTAIVSTYLAKRGGIAVGSSAYLMPCMEPTTCAVLAGLTDLGGFAVSYAVADEAQIAALAAPVVKTIEEQIEEVISNTKAFIERAVAVAKPDGGSMQARTGETIREQIEAARDAATLWRSRLNLATLDVDDALDKLDAEAKAAADAAKAAQDKRRENTKLAKEIAALKTKGGVA